MAKRKTPTPRKTRKPAVKKPAAQSRRGRPPSLREWLGRKWRRFRRRVLLGLGALVLFALLAPTVLNPPITYTIWSERHRLGSVDREWVPIENVAPVMRRAVVAAEDANFCLHWGFDMAAIRAAIAAEGRFGASTITQQTVKNVYLWQGRSWPRKALEAVLTPLVEIAWTKRRILEIYLNVAEFDEGVFGIDAAAYHYFRTTPAKLTAAQAAALAVVLPDPKDRDAARLTPALERRARLVRDGAATIRADGRAACFDG
ncbi:monofunctional biosynthetic peptidoglycan transglycosylase [Rhodovulum adriaticum]|uniref:Biosynthetic peptidoglycan transglycosylase n=1 Tax=Rhodovulum adriaticum TaxID=35804 RepID=A0A4R2P133_RHOAD|nr:monofunctional biosynthetic peptidoglycan transglycosylase [Rhodovulum adriaticum]MBK1635297.1 monofunctional biosynthetic peptidoglycan transglycosylase [Rhodovulum adriaticum]TCP27768.1 monofunctional biosynthetic peptidoglycan transglycosylase [Rhodovulum adriaticum]